VSKFDGSKDPLTIGPALVEIASRVAWPTQEHAREVELAIKGEYGIFVPEPDKPVYGDPRDETLVAQDRELAALRAEKAQRENDDKIRAQQEEIERLKQEAAGNQPVAPVTDPPKPSDPKKSK
jgi:hypothetical protein